MSRNILMGQGRVGLDPQQQDRLDSLERQKRSEYRDFRLRRFLQVKPEKREQMLEEILEDIMKRPPNIEEYKFREENELRSLQSQDHRIPMPAEDAFHGPPPYPYLWDFTYEELEAAHANALFDEEIQSKT